MASSGFNALVAPHAGAWIETSYFWRFDNALVSRPMRARGLKLAECCIFSVAVLVAPHAGAWIETEIDKGDVKKAAVAPHAGAWIETRQRHQP